MSITYCFYLSVFSQPISSKSDKDEVCKIKEYTLEYDDDINTFLPHAHAPALGLFALIFLETGIWILW